MPGSETAIALLEFGRLIYQAERRRSDQETPRHQQAEEQLLEMLRRDRTAWRKTGLRVDTGTSEGSTVLRVVGYVAYQQLCSTRLGAVVCDVVRAVAGEDPSVVLETRQTISRLLIAKQLALKNGHSVELGEPMLEFLAGGKQAPPLTLTEFDLQRVWHQAEVGAKKRKAREPMRLNALPTTKQVAARIAKDVIGLDAQIRTLSCRMALHMRRAAMIGAGQDPGTANECLLLVGPSGCGKTFVVETAGRVCGVPFASISASDLSCTAYVGLGIDDGVKSLISNSNDDVQKARHGILFIDEWDKKRTSNWEYGGRDVAGSSVQQEVLRLVEGTEFVVGGRRGSIDWAPITFNSKGTAFVFAGAYIGLQQLLHKRSGRGIGFTPQQSQPERRYLHDALVDYGMIEEFMNRLTGIIVLTEPTIGQLREIAERAVIPAINRILSTFGAGIELEPGATTLMAECALDTRTFARGLKAVMAQLVENTVFEMHKGVVRLGTTDVQRAIESAGLGATTI